MTPSTLELRLTPWVRAAARADGGAFEHLVEASKGSVTAITLAISRDVAASEDIAQEVFLTAWRRLPELENPASFLPWVRQIARLTARTWVRDDRSRRRRLGRSPQAWNDPADLLESVADGASGPEGSLLDHERQAVLSEALEAMPDESREVMVLFYREGRSTRQVASLLGLSDAAVRKRLQRARAGLRDEVLERFSELARASAPGAVFTASVLAATASAPAAQAAVLVGAGKSGWAKGLTVLGGAGLGWIGGALGVVLGLRRDFAEARDAHERRQLGRLRATALAAVTLACLAFLAPPLHDHWSAPVAVYLGFLASMAAIYLLWLPRILRRRFLAEEEGELEAVEERLMERRRQAIFGLIFGGLSGGVGLVAGLLGSGLLTL